MGLRRLKAGRAYAAFRRWRVRLRERLRRLGLALDAFTGGHRLRREALQALLEGQAEQLRATAELVERVRALEAAVARLEAVAGAAPADAAPGAARAAR